MHKKTRKKIILAFNLLIYSIKTNTCVTEIMKIYSYQLVEMTCVPYREKMDQ